MSDNYVPLRFAKTPKPDPGFLDHIEQMEVEIQEDFVATLYVIPTLLPKAAYVSAEIAERIKRTHAPTSKNQKRQSVWVPHVPRHNHTIVDEDGNIKERGPNTGCSALTGRGNNLINRSANAEAKRAAAYHLRKKERLAQQRAEQAQPQQDKETQA